MMAAMARMFFSNRAEVASTRVGITEGFEETGSGMGGLNPLFAALIAERSYNLPQFIKRSFVLRPIVIDQRVQLVTHSPTPIYFDVALTRINKIIPFLRV
jgi:hypothetical protein